VSSTLSKATKRPNVLLLLGENIKIFYNLFES
jgi:hypothetical protein